MEVCEREFAMSTVQIRSLSGRFVPSERCVRWGGSDRLRSLLAVGRKDRSRWKSTSRSDACMSRPDAHLVECPVGRELLRVSERGWILRGMTVRDRSRCDARVTPLGKGKGLRSPKKIRASLQRPKLRWAVGSQSLGAKSSNALQDRASRSC